MSVLDLYQWLAAHPLPVLLLGGSVPFLVGGSSAVLRLAGGHDASQQVANLGIAVGLAAVLVEVLAVVYAIGVAGADPVTSAPVALVIVPPWLAVSGFAVEHFLHPGRQERIRRPIRVAMQLVAVVVVLVAIFSVLRIHMLVFSGMTGFVLFVLVLIGLFWFLVRRGI